MYVIFVYLLLENYDVYSYAWRDMLDLCDKL